MLQLLEQAGKDPRVDVRPALKNHAKVVEQMAWAHLLVVPSLWPENHPLVVEEAFSTGLPVAASRIGGLEEMLGRGRYGALFEPGDEQGLGRALQSFLDRPEIISRISSALPRPRSIVRDCSLHLNLYRRLIRRHANC